MTPGSSDAQARAGVLVGIAAYTLWGFFPIYFRRIGDVAPLDVLAWRIVLSAALLGLVMLVWRGPSRLRLELRPGAQWPLVLGATLVISANWLIFIVAIGAGEVLQSSLGYFLVPLVSSTLGMLVFNERPNRWKIASPIVAAIGISISCVVAGVVPVYAIGLAATFGAYGMLRKRMSLDSTTGLLLEILLLSPLAIAWLWLAGAPLDTFTPSTQRWLMASGAVTLLPLLLMVFAARRIELGTLGVLQYIAPTMHFALAVGLYGETLDAARAIGFAATLVAVALWLVGAWPRQAAAASR